MNDNRKKVLKLPEMIQVSTAGMTWRGNSIFTCFQPAWNFSAYVKTTDIEGSSL